MANNFPAAQCLRSSVVGVCRVGEGASLEVGNLNLDVESGIGSNILARLRGDDNSRNHICGRWNITHDCNI